MFDMRNYRSGVSGFSGLLNNPSFRGGTLADTLTAQQIGTGVQPSENIGFSGGGTSSYGPEHETSAPENGGQIAGSAALGAATKIGSGLLSGAIQRGEFSPTSISPVGVVGGIAKGLLGAAQDSTSANKPNSMTANLGLGLLSSIVGMFSPPVGVISGILAPAAYRSMFGERDVSKAIDSAINSPQYNASLRYAGIINDTPAETYSDIVASKRAAAEAAANSDAAATAANNGRGLSGDGSSAASRSAHGGGIGRDSGLGGLGGLGGGGFGGGDGGGD